MDTSRIHTEYEDFRCVPILTSLGCCIRRPKSNSLKFDAGLRRRVGAGSKLMVDSGGFVLMTKRRAAWNVTRVAELYKRLDADLLVSLDLPPRRTDSRGVRGSLYARTLANLSELVERYGRKIVPVVHGVNLQEIESNCGQIGRVMPNPVLVGVGGIVPALQGCGRVNIDSRTSPQRGIAEIMQCVRAHFPKSGVHVFGVGSLHTVLAMVALGAQSVDSIGWRQAAGFGSVFIPGRQRRLLTSRERIRPCRPFVDDLDKEILRDCVCPACRGASPVGENIARLAAHFKPRAAHNIWVLYKEVASYLSEHEAGRGAYFLSSRLSEAWLGAITAVPSVSRRTVQLSDVAVGVRPFTALGQPP